MVGIREVAKLAGVSPATVSRVINGTAKVSSDKRERVLSAISETGFVPNEVARSLYKKSAKLIGLVIPSIKNPYFTQMAGAVEKTADRYGYRILLYDTGGDIGKEKAAISMLSSMNADGIILTTGNDALQPYLTESKIPIVMIDRILPDIACGIFVYCNHYEGGRMATEHLVACGCRSIVCVREPQNISSARARYEGYRDVCTEHNLTEQIIESDFDAFEPFLKTEEILERYPDVDGIVACNDIVAISIYKALYKKNIAVPEQIQLVGFDNVELASLVTPELTTVAQPIDEMGGKAVELIINGNGDGPNTYIYPISLKIRETTKQKII